MRAVILAGGKGTRLRPYTTVLPKPLVPVGDRPILELILRQLARSGFERVDLCVGYHAELISAYFSQDAILPDGLELRYVHELEPLGTAGSLALIERPDESFLVMNGDILTDLDYADFIDFHRRQGAQLTIASYAKQVRIDLGVLESEEGCVSDYLEKPTLDYTVSMGIYAYEPAVLQRIDGGRLDFPDLVRALVADGEKVMLYPFSGRWFDIGTVEDHQRALEEIDRNPSLVEP